jgi:DNA helicase-2/ATP-dependent DNA helicase PcrA
VSRSLRDKLKAEILDPLNDVQRQAVEHPGGPLLIVAGAGSGKTRVITHRIAYLCRLQEVRPYRIAAVTFTNKAAREMAERLQKLIGPMAEEVMVRTFHGLGLHILRREAAAVGIKSNFTIYDAGMQETLLKKILKKNKIEPALLSPSAAAEFINRARDQLKDPDQSQQMSAYLAELPDIYGQYLKELRAAGSLDFGDLIYLPVKLFMKDSEILEKYAGRWQHLMIDEYQDTNHAQYMLGRLLSGSSRNILVVGDEDQSIYSWRGADIRNILAFEKDYPDAKVLKLVENYRSTPQILRAAHSVIKNNQARREKELFTQNEGGLNLEYRLYPAEEGFYNDMEGESAAVLSRIRALKRDGFRLTDMAIFYRTNAQSRSLETALNQAGMPYRIYGGFRFYDRREIKDLMAYLAVIVNPLDDVSLERIINMPLRGIGDSTVAGLQALALERNISLLDALALADKKMRSAKKLADLHARFLSWQKKQTEELPSALADRVIKESGYAEMLKKSGKPEDISRLENMYEFINAMQNYEGRAGQNASLVDFLQSISLVTSEENPGADQESLTLMTLHNSKGLEFPVVFIVGLEEGTFPHSLSLDEGGEEEERRLMYVGLTRARERVFLSSCQSRRVFGQLQRRLPSRFLSEIDAAVLNSQEKGTQGEARKRNPVAQAGDSETYQEGERVEHVRYGLGTIVSVEKTVAGQKLGIRFEEEDRERFFLAEVAPLKRA